MPPKNSRKKKAAPTAGRTANSRPANRAANSRSAKPHVSKTHAVPPGGTYVSVAPLTVLLTDVKPKGRSTAARCADFAEARSAAIDALLAAIEDGERRLAACKRATSLEDLRKL